jgi:hypothetical protein
VDTSKVDERLLDEAMRIGEQNVDRAIRYGTLSVRYRRAITAAVYLLTRSKNGAALEVLVKALADEEKRERR